MTVSEGHTGLVFFTADTTGHIIKKMEKKIVLLKKNPCPDCDFCQGCSETRCSLCKSLDCPSSKKVKKKKEHVPLFRKF